MNNALPPTPEAWLARAQTLLPWMTQLRRTIHRHPEAGSQEVRTSALVCRELEQMGIPFRRLTETAVEGLIRGGAEGPCVAIRADMDALPIEEDCDVPFRSEVKGMMHACGHDMHTAALLGAARLLADCRQSLPGSVKLFFQPDEEYNGGAQRMMDAGCMQSPAVEAVFGGHCDPGLPWGSVGLRSGPLYAASNPFTITVHGQSTHGAEPHKGVDALRIGVQIATALEVILTRESDPTQPILLHIGTFHAGTAVNIVADTAVLTGTLRCYGRQNRLHWTERIRQIAQGIAQTMGGRADVDQVWGYDGIINDEGLTRLADRTFRSLLGGEEYVRPARQVLLSEDFGAFGEKCPVCFYQVGTGEPGQQNAPLHSAQFNPREEALAVFAAAHAAVASAYLTEK